MRKYRLSHSALELLHTCERKFQLDRLLVGSEREASEHLSFGHSVGAGIQSYLQHQDEDLALYEAWLAYWPIVETQKKDQARALLAMQSSFRYLDTILEEWELVSFEGKPTVEMSFRLDIDSKYYYVGYIDAVLKNRFTGQYVVLEIKHTGLLLLDVSPLYMHSGQAVGYSVVLDKIAGQAQASYGVLYVVLQLGKAYNEVKTHVLPFNKTLLDRLNWFITLGLDVKHLHEMEELGVYPKRGSSCLTFMRPCQHFGTCQLHSLDTPRVEEPDDTKYQFVYALEELVDDHLARVNAGEGTADVEAVGMYD